MDIVEPSQIIKLVMALMFVVALMTGLAHVLKRFGLSNSGTLSGKDARLKIVDTIHLDARRKMMLVQRDDVQHLVIIGTASETVVETGIKPVQNQEQAEKTETITEQDS